MHRTLHKHLADSDVEHADAVELAVASIVHLSISVQALMHVLALLDPRKFYPKVQAPLEYKIDHKSALLVAGLDLDCMACQDEGFEMMAKALQDVGTANEDMVKMDMAMDG